MVRDDAFWVWMVRGGVERPRSRPHFGPGTGYGSMRYGRCSVLLDVRRTNRVSRVTERC